MSLYFAGVDYSVEQLETARHNLTDVVSWKLQSGEAKSNPKEAFHALGNWVISQTVLNPSYESLSQPSQLIPYLSDELQSTGMDPEKADIFCEIFITWPTLRRIFPLCHIPAGSPEVNETPRSRTLNCNEFVKQALALGEDSLD